MIVTIGKRTYRMNRKEADGLLNIAGENVPIGIYAVEKNGHIELLNIKCTSSTQLKEKIRAFKSDGYKVYANKGR